MKEQNTTMPIHANAVVGPCIHLNGDSRCGTCKHFGDVYLWEYHWCNKVDERRAEFRQHAKGMDLMDAFRHCPDPGVEAHYGAEQCSFYETIEKEPTNVRNVQP